MSEKAEMTLKTVTTPENIPETTQNVESAAETSAQKSVTSEGSANAENPAGAEKRCPCCMGDAEEDGEFSASAEEIKTTARSAEEYKKLIHRLNRIEGQIRGIRGMVERSAYCPDILVQSAAVTAAMNAFNRELLANHIRTCVADGIRAGNDEVVDELLKTLQKLMK